MIAPAPTQRKFPLDDEPRLVLATLEDARRQLKRWHANEKDIAALIDEGILCAWNIATVRSDLFAEYRILPESIDWADRRQDKPFPWTWTQIVARLFRGFDKDRAHFFSPEIAFLLNCTRKHIIYLIDAGQMDQLAGSKYRRGQTGAAIVSKDSLLAFFKTRFEGMVPC